MKIDNKLLVSVIIPTYNSRRDMLKKAIESVYTQTYKYIELIVVDDASEEAVKIMLKEFQAKYKFTLIELDKNSGSAGRPLNTGIKVAQGVYIALFSHDDYWLPEKIALQVDFMQKNPQYAYSYTRCYSLNYRKSVQLKARRINYQQGDIFYALLFQKFTIPGLTVLVRKECLEHINGYDESVLVEDFDMFLRLSRKYQAGFIDKFLAVYCTHESNTHHTRLNSMILGKKQALKKWKKDPNFHDAYLLDAAYNFHQFPKFKEYFCLCLFVFCKTFRNKNVGIVFLLKRMAVLWFLFLRKNNK